VETPVSRRSSEEREAKVGARRSNIIGIFIWNLDGEIIEANEAFLQMVESRVRFGLGSFTLEDGDAAEWRAGDEIFTSYSTSAGRLVGSMISPVEIPDEDPMMLESTRRRTSPPFSKIAVETGVLQRDRPCDASSSSSAVRSGVKTCEVSVFSR